MAHRPVQLGPRPDPPDAATLGPLAADGSGRWLRSLPRPSVANLYVATFAMAAACGALMLALPFYAFNLGAAAGLVGLLGAASTAAYVLGCGLVRPASNRLSLTGALLVAALALAMSQVQHLAALLVLVTANGMMMALFWPPVMGWISAGRQGQLLN